MKKKLFAASISLTMAFIMMVSSSFAWYTVSTTAALNNVEVTMTAYNNLEIASGTVDNGKLIAPVEVTANDGNNFATWGAIVQGGKVNLEFPAFKTGAGDIATIVYNDTGRTTNVNPANGTLGGFLADQTTGAITGFYSADNTNDNVANAKKIAAVYPVWLRTNVKGGITDLTVGISKESVKVSVNGNDPTLASGVNTSLKKNQTDYYTFAEALEVELVIPKNDDFTAGANIAAITKTANAETYTLAQDTATLAYVVVYLKGDMIGATDVDKKLDFTGIAVNFTSAAVSSANTTNNA